MYFAAFDPRSLSEVGSPAPFSSFTPHLMVSRHFGLTDYPRARVRPQGSAPPQQGNRGSPPVLLRLHSGWTPPFACFRGSGGLTSGAASYDESGTRTERRVAPLVGVMRYPEFRRAASNRWPDVRGACTPPRVVSRLRVIMSRSVTPPLAGAFGRWPSYVPHVTPHFFPGQLF